MSSRDRGSGDGEKPARDYEVGYGKPPKHTQFQKGQSGNKNGRRGKKDRTAYGAMIREEFDKAQTIVEGGRKIKLSRARVIIRQTINDAQKGSASARKEAVKLIRGFAGAAGGAFLTDEELAQQARDEEKKKALAARLVSLLNEKAAAVKNEGGPRYGSAAWALQQCRTAARAKTGEAEARQQLLDALDRELAAIRARESKED
jgi:hypothetical protein